MSKAGSYLDAIAPLVGKEGLAAIIEASEADARSLLAALRAQLMAQDVAGVHATLHALKGITRNVGMERTGRLIDDGPPDSVATSGDFCDQLTATFSDELASIRRSVLGTHDD